MIDPVQMGASAPQGVSNTQTGPMPETVAGPDMQAMGIQAPPPPAPKPVSMIPNDVKYLLAEALNSSKMEAAKNLAETMGDPRGAAHVKEADLLRVWRKRNPEVDPLFEKFVNKRSDEDITRMMYPGRIPLIKYGRRTYTEQVEFAERMAKLDQDPKYRDLDNMAEDVEDEYIPPQSKFPSKGEHTFKRDYERDLEEERLANQEE